MKDEVKFPTDNAVSMFMDFRGFCAIYKPNFVTTITMDSFLRTDGLYERLLCYEPFVNKTRDFIKAMAPWKDIDASPLQSMIVSDSMVSWAKDDIRKKTLHYFSEAEEALQVHPAKEECHIRNLGDSLNNLAKMLEGLEGYTEIVICGRMLSASAESIDSIFKVTYRGLEMDAIDINYSIRNIFQNLEKDKEMIFSISDRGTYR